MPYDPRVDVLGQMWRDRYQGVPPVGAIARAKGELEAEGVEFEEIVVAWEAYLTATEASYASPARFAQTYGQWVAIPAVPKYVAPEKPRAPEPPPRALPAGRLRLMADEMQEKGQLKRVAPDHRSRTEDFLLANPSAAPIVQALDLEVY